MNYINISETEKCKVRVNDYVLLHNCVIYNGEKYLLKVDKKYPENNSNSDLTMHRQSSIAEHIASTLLNKIGFTAQKTLLVKLKDDTYGVLCKIFLHNNEQLITIKDVTTDERVENKDNIMNTWSYVKNKIDTEIKYEQGFENNFLTMMVLDYLIGNKDRNPGNYGFIKSDNAINVAPLFDNGASLGCQVRASHIDDICSDNNRRRNLLKTLLKHNCDNTFENAISHKFPSYYYKVIKDIITKYTCSYLCGIIDEYSHIYRTNIAIRLLEKAYNDLVLIYENNKENNITPCCRADNSNNIMSSIIEGYNKTEGG